MSVIDEVRLRSRPSISCPARRNQPMVPQLQSRWYNRTLASRLPKWAAFPRARCQSGRSWQGLSKEAFMHVNKALAILALVLFGTIPSAFAQSDTGAIDGRVLDAQKSAVPGVTVTAKNLGTGLTRTAVSSGGGTFHLEALPAGSYD